MKYIFITCHGHSGSTLLAKLLSLHAEGLNVGEIKHFADYYSKNDPCGCGQLLQDCPFWNNVLASGAFPSPLTEESFPVEGVRRQPWVNYAYFLTLFSWPRLYQWLSSFPSTLQALNRRNAQNQWKLVRATASVGQKSVIIDKSMSISRYQEIFLTQPPGIDFLLVHLVRDGRANMYSYMKRFAQAPRKAALKWRKTNRKIETAKFFSHNRNVIEVRYEDLIAQPEQVCQDIFAQIGMDFEAQIDDLSQAFDHSIGGNDDKLMGYQKIRTDRRWEDQLTEEELAIFDKTAGKLNKKYGYQ